MKNSIIIPTYTNFNGLKECVQSLINTTIFDETDVWIVCNGSSKECVEWCTTIGQPFHVISCPEALGYTKAVNVGIMASQGENLILFNDDNVILEWGGHNEWLNMLIRPLEDGSIAATGSSLDYWAKGKPFLVFFCAATTRRMMHEFGYLDEAFNPGAGEDADYCLKAQSRGYKVIQVPTQFEEWKTSFPIYHVGHMTCSRMENWSDVAKRNTALLEQRYPRTDEDRAFQADFSAGRQNIHLWQKKT